MRDDFNSRNHLREIEAAARELRAQRGFAGTAVPLASIQQQLLNDFKQSASIKHHGDKGSARENLLRGFLKDKGYLPARYGVTEQPSYVVATNGMISRQMDILIYDALNAPRLLDLGGVQYFPVESVYGTIQVKSDLDSTACVKDALDNLASFKALSYAAKTPPKGFGALFAYDASLKWKTLFGAVEEWEAAHPGREWPNIVAVLNQGLILNLDGRRAVVMNEEIARASKPQLMGIPTDDDALTAFYLLLMDVLGALDLPRVPTRQYVSLPTRSGRHAVRFGHGSFAEVRRCPQHGQYLRELREGAADEIIDACAADGPVDAGAIMDEAYGTHESSGRWGMVRFFNPEALPAARVFLIPDILHGASGPIHARAMGFEELLIDDERYWLPHYYTAKHSLISGCPRCPEPSAELALMTIDDWEAAMEARAATESVVAAEDSEALDGD